MTYQEFNKAQTNIVFTDLITNHKIAGSADAQWNNFHGVLNSEYDYINHATFNSVIELLKMHITLGEK